jgi:hypothetical protein
MNGVYDSAVVVFPLIIFLAASEEITSKFRDEYVPFWRYFLSYVYYSLPANINLYRMG